MTAPPGDRLMHPAPRSGAGLALRLTLVMLVVVLVGELAAWLVATSVGPRLFAEHMEMAGSMPGSVETHAAQAFDEANTLTVTAALGTSFVTIVVVSGLLSRRVSASLRKMTEAAREVAAGNLAARVEPPHLGREFDELATSFNRMGARLEQNHELRRRLMGDVAHELRTPTATIALTIDAIEDGVEVLDDATVATLRDQASRLTRLAADLAAVAQTQSGEMVLDLRPAAPAELVRAAEHAARARLAENEVRLEVDVAADLPEVAVDADRFAQILGNLLDNALRHTPAGGRVSVAARRDRDRVVLTVTDTGDGVAPEHLPHLFERFYRVDAARDRASGGSGIGLAIVRALVIAHGGTVEAASDGVGHGARFTVSLPTA